MTRNTNFVVIGVFLIFVSALTFLVNPGVAFAASNVALLLLSATLVVVYWKAFYKVLMHRHEWPPAYTLALGITVQWAGLGLRQLSFYFPTGVSHGPEPHYEFLHVINFPMWMFGVGMMVLGGLYILLALWRVVSHE